jgi:hypothetical protein
VCAATRALTVPPGTTVYFCYTVTNVGTMLLPYHQLYDTELGDLLVGFPYDLAPGQSLSTVDLGLVISAAVTEATVNDGVWTAYADDDHYAVASDRATVRTGSAALAVSKAVALDPRQCGGRTMLIVRPDAQVHYCVTLQNDGSVAFDRYVLVDPALGLRTAGALLLRPGARLTIDGRQLAALGPVTVSADLTNTLFVTLTATPGGEQGGEEDAGAMAGAGAGSLFTATAQATARVLLDTDGDTVPDCIEGHGDLDGDGVPNHKDPDCDGDGYSDVLEVGPEPLQPLISGCNDMPDFQEPLVPGRWPVVAPGGSPLRCCYLPVLAR